MTHENGRPRPGATTRTTAIAVAALVCATAPEAWAHKYKFHTLYSFCAEADCADGADPVAGLVVDQAGNLYGTTVSGGAGDQNGGTVFALQPSGKKWKHKTLYSFCSQANCADGNSPLNSLVVDTSGNLYGTTRIGGPYGNNAGVAFELQPNATGKKWKYQQLHAFCAQAPCLDGNNPSSGLTYFGAATGSSYDGVSPLFGTTVQGGSVTYGGVAYKIEPQNKRWKQTVLYNFCSVQPDCADGYSPSGGCS